MNDLCVSALAWPESEHEEALKILKTYHVNFIELIPGRIKTISEEIKLLQKYSLKPRAFQALLFGTSNLNLFGSESEREALFLHLKGLMAVASQLGVRNLIFGSPKNRSYDELKWSQKEANQLASEFFKKLGDEANAKGTVICIEPNPKFYGTNFLNTTTETAEFVQTVNHRAIRLNLDLGAVTMNAENLTDVITRFSAEIGHIHISEPELNPIGYQGKERHKEYAQALAGLASRPVVSIEIKGTTNWKDHLISSLEVVREIYG